MLTAGALFAQHTYSAADIEDGERGIYRLYCTTCHGPDGNALRTADLSKGKFRRTSTYSAGTENELVTIMEKGIPGSDMKPNESLNDFQAATIVAHACVLFAANPSLTSGLSGDPARGKELFENKAGCLSCHQGEKLGILAWVPT